MSLYLQKLSVFPDEEDGQLFTIVLDNARQLLSNAKSLESGEIKYGGHSWSLVCMRKDEEHLGVFLKWKYADGSSLSNVSVKVRFTISLMHQCDHKGNVVFTSHQRFDSTQTILGRTKFILISEALAASHGYLDDTGRRLIFELGLSRIVTKYEKSVDVSARNRIKKNPSGVYFDTPTFQLYNQKWYIRFYLKKLNSNNLPAIYLYLTGRTAGLSMDVRFTLNMAQETTEILSYDFGEGAKFDGFGKTLPDVLPNSDKLPEISVGVEVTGVAVYKLVPIRLRQSLRGQSNVQQISRLYSPTPFSQPTPMLSMPSNDAFLDHEGNTWRVDLVRDPAYSQNFTLCMDRGVHHIQHNRSLLIAWTGLLLSRDLQKVKDIPMSGPSIIGYFSNFTDDKGYLMHFPALYSQLEDATVGFIDESCDVIIRIDLISCQSSSFVARAGSKLDYLNRHLILAKQELQENHRSLMDMKEASASRASLSILDDHPTSESSASSGFGASKSLNGLERHKSYESLDQESSIGESHKGEDPTQRSLLLDLIINLSTQALSQTLNESFPLRVAPTKRTLSKVGDKVELDQLGLSKNGRESESFLLERARLGASEVRKMKDTVTSLVNFLLKKFPIKVSDVVDLGSIGTATTAQTRNDVDLVLFCPELPCKNQERWMPSLLKTVATYLQRNLSSNNFDPQSMIPSCSDYCTSDLSVQFRCDDIDVDLFLTYDPESLNSGDGRNVYEMLYNESSRFLKNKSLTSQQLSWFALASSRFKKKFLANQRNEVKDLIKFFKMWRDGVSWQKYEHRPNSYLISLLVIKAVEECNSVELMKIANKLLNYITFPELRITWNVFYNPSVYQASFEPPTPLVRDPTQPFINVADSLEYWGQFRTEYSTWCKRLTLGQ